MDVIQVALVFECSLLQLKPFFTAARWHRVLFFCYGTPDKWSQPPFSNRDSDHDQNSLQRLATVASGNMFPRCETFVIYHSSITTPTRGVCNRDSPKTQTQRLTTRSSSVFLGRPLFTKPCLIMISSTERLSENWMCSHKFHDRSIEGATSIRGRSSSFQVITFMYLKRASNIHGESIRTFSPSPQDIVANSILHSAVETQVAKRPGPSLPRQRNHIRPRPSDQLDTYPSSHGPHHPALEAQLCRMRSHRVLIRKMAPL